MMHTLYGIKILWGHLYLVLGNDFIMDYFISVMTNVSEV